MQRSARSIWAGVLGRKLAVAIIMRRFTPAEAAQPGHLRGHLLAVVLNGPCPQRRVTFGCLGGVRATSIHFAYCCVEVVSV